MKKKLIIAMTAAMLAFGGALVHADNVAVTIDGQYLSMDVPAQIMNERTMVPMRAIFEALGATVNWNGDNQQIRADAGEISILMQIDSPHMYVASDTRSDVITLDQPPVIVEGRTLVPARAISEALDANVGWDGANSTVNIDSGMPITSSEAYLYKGNVYYSLSLDPSIYVYDGNTNYRYAAGGVPSQIAIYNDYIFYTNANTDSICRMDLDGSNRKILASDFVSTDISFLIKNNRIYFFDDIACKISSMDLDGNDLQIMTEVPDKYFYGKFFEFPSVKDSFGTPHKIGQTDYINTLAANRNYLYYMVSSNSHEEDSLNSEIYRFSFENGKNERIKSEDVIIICGRDTSGRVVVRKLESDNEFYVFNEPSTSLIPYSSISQNTNQWLYYREYTTGLNNTFTKRWQPSTGEIEILAKGFYAGSNTDTVIYDVRQWSMADWNKYNIISHDVYAMDSDGNNIRLVNSFINNNVETGITGTTTNTAFDNTQPANQQTTCAVCHGLGYYDCPICHGEGLVRRYTLAGTELKTCTHCGGRKRITCTVCGGDGILNN